MCVYVCVLFPNPVGLYQPLSRKFSLHTSATIIWLSSVSLGARVFSFNWPSMSWKWKQIPSILIKTNKFKTQQMVSEDQFLKNLCRNQVFMYIFLLVCLLLWVSAWHHPLHCHSTHPQPLFFCFFLWLLRYVCLFLCIPDAEYWAARLDVPWDEGASGGAPQTWRWGQTWMQGTRVNIFVVKNMVRT